MYRRTFQGEQIEYKVARSVLRLVEVIPKESGFEMQAAQKNSFNAAYYIIA